MRVLIVTAVPPERDAVLAGLAAHGSGRDADSAEGRSTVLAAGVGPAAAAAATAAELTSAALAGRPYPLVVSAGIGGGFAPVEPPDLVVASTIVAADLGADTPEGFRSVAELGFGADTVPVPGDLARAVADRARAVLGPVLTVSTVTGTAARAAELAARHPGAAAEAMEGFGVAQAAAASGVPVLEVRAVSNPVGPRDRAAWRVPEALEALAAAFGKTAPVIEGWARHGGEG